MKKQLEWEKGMIKSVNRTIRLTNILNSLKTIEDLDSLLTHQHQLSVNETLEKVKEIIKIMWIKKEKDKTGYDVGWNSALAEFEVRLKQLKKK